MGGLTVVAIVIIWALMGISVWQVWQLLREIYPRFREVRLAFISQLTLKLWVFAYTGWILYYYLPGEPDQRVRQAVVLVLILSLLVQCAWTVWAFHRWRKRR